MSYLAFDTELTGLNLLHGCKPFLVSICHEDYTTKSFVWVVNPFTRQPIIPQADRTELQQLLTNHTRVTHNAAIDMGAMKSIGLDISWSSNINSPIGPTSFEDTLVASHLYNSSEPHGLKLLAAKYLKLPADDEQELRTAVQTARRYARAINHANTKAGKQVTFRIAAEKDPANPKSHLPELAGWKPKASDDESSWAVCDYWLPAAVEIHKALTEAGLLIKNLFATNPTEASAATKEAIEQAQSTRAYNLARTYCEQDALRTMGLWLELYKPWLESASEDIRRIYTERKAIAKICHDMKSHGVTFFPHKAASESARYEKEHNYHVSELCRLNKLESFNINSPKQKVSLFFSKLNLPVLFRNKPSTRNPEGSPKTSKDALLATRERYDPSSIEYRTITHHLIATKFSKAASYLKSYSSWQLPIDHEPFTPPHINPSAKISRIHGNQNPTGTRTTRFAHSGPNQGNVGNGEDPTLEAELKDAGLNIRKVYGPAHNRVFLAIDYSQLQLIIFAYVSRDPSLMKAFTDGWDAHTFMAHKIFDTNEPTKGQRRIAKNTNFGFIFGAQPDKIEATAGMPGLWDIVSSMFPNAVNFIATNANKANRYNKIHTAGNYPLRTPYREGYIATNYIVQGTEGDIVQEAMRLCVDYLETESWKPLTAVQFQRSPDAFADFASYEHNGESFLPTKRHGPWLGYGSRKNFIDACHRGEIWYYDDIAKPFLSLTVHDELIFDLPANDWKRHVLPLCSLMRQAALKYGIPADVSADLIKTDWASGVELDLDQFMEDAVKLTSEKQS